MTKTHFSVGLVLLGILALPSPAAAITCPNTASTTDNEYTVVGSGTTTATQCVSEFGGGNLNGNVSGPVANWDDFLNGPEDDGDPLYFQPGGAWTSFCSTNSATPGDPDNTCDSPAPYDFTWDSDSWSFTGVAGTQYALGIKDGADPFWAVFLLSHTDVVGDVLYEGSWSILKNGQNNPDALSHFAIYDRAGGGGGNGQTPVPEPASLLLLGTGLGVVARKFRRKAAAK